MFIKEAHNAQNLRMLKNPVSCLPPPPPPLTREETQLEKAVNCPRSQRFETSFHHITKLSLSRIPRGENVRKPLRFLLLYANGCSQLDIRLLWFCTEASLKKGSAELLSSKGKNLQKIIDCHLKYFQMSAFKSRESWLLPQVLLEGIIYLRRLQTPNSVYLPIYSGFYFSTPPNNP